MNQAFDGIIARFDTRERAELGQLGDCAFDERAITVSQGNFIPGIGEELTNAEADAILVRVNANDFDADFLAFRQRLAGVCDVPPGDFCQVDQTFCAADIDECAKFSRLTTRPSRISRVGVRVTIHCDADALRAWLHVRRGGDGYGGDQLPSP